MYSTSFNISHDMALTAAGMEQSIDDRTLFCTPAPLAASTIARDAIRMRQMTIPDIKGSFLNEVSQLSSQSDSLNLSQELMRPNFNITADANIIPQAKLQKMDSGSDLIHFSAVTEKDGGTITPEEKSDSLTDVSSRSSMGLIPNELLSDLSSSMLPLNTPKGAPAAKVGKLNLGSVLSPCREIVGDSTEWSDSSKQDSKDLPMGRSHLMDTVKKKPQFLAEPSVKIAGHGQRALAFITEGLLGNVDEGSELDLSVCDVEFGAEELQKLDEEFSDICEDKDSDDDEISDEEPFHSLPIKSSEKNQETDDLAMTLNNGTDSRTRNIDMDSTLQMQGGDPQAETTFHEEENRLGEGQESDKDTKGNQQIAGMSKSGLLDACYFHKTPIPFPGDGEDTEVASLRSSHTLTSQRGAAEGENLLATLRRQFMSGDGSEIDTEDELEAVREELALSARQRGQGADKEDNGRSDLPQPVGLENDAEFAVRAGNSYRLSEHQHAQQFSFLVRQSAEGHTALSPVPGGEGDGSSGSESNGNDSHHRKRKNENHVTSIFPMSQDTSVSRLPHLDITYRDKLEEESGLQAVFFMPTTAKLHLYDTEVTMNPSLEGSSFHVEDILRHPDMSASANFGQKGDKPCLETSETNKQDVPLEDQFAAMESSFGSFGLEHAVGQESLLTAEDKRLDDLNVQAQPSVPEMTNPTEDPFKRPLAPPLKKKEKAVIAACKNGDEQREAHLSCSGILGKTTDHDLKHQLLELGIDIGEENFQTADSAKAKLAADEEQFEHDNKFSEHHRLCQAVGQTWDGNDTTLSGYLGGDDRPEHLEMSISSYMATRTEALGRLDGGDGVPRPQFGNPVYSPPHRTIPVKLMSPPSACSTLTLYSRTEGEGNEDGDRTLSAGEDLSFSSASQSQSGVKKIPEDHETVQRDISSILLDLTHGNTTDLTMEDALSISSVMNFVKQHNFSSSSNFAQAVLKFSSLKKQQVSEGESRKQTPVLKDNSKQLGALHGTESAGSSREGTVTHPMVSSETRVLGAKSSTSLCGAVTPTSSRDILSPLKGNMGKGSRLPILSGSSLTRVSEKRERSVLHQDLGDQSSKMPTARCSPQQVLQSQLVTAASDGTAPQNLIPTQLPYKHEMSINKQKDDDARSVQGSLTKGCLLGDGQDPAGQITVEESSKVKLSPAACVGKKGSGQSRSSSLSCETDFHSGTESNLENVNSRSETESFAVLPRKHPFRVSFEPVVGMQVESNNLRLEKTSVRNNDAICDLPLNVPANVQKDRSSRERISVKATQERRTHSAGDSYNVFSDINTNNYRSDVKQRPERTRLSETTSSGWTSVCAGSISRDLLPKSGQHDHHVPDGMENSASASKPDLDPGMCRKEAVGVEDLSLMDSQHFEVVSDSRGGGDCNEQVKAELNTIKQTGSGPFPDRKSLNSVQECEQSVTEKPILLTGSSLLKTEFAQKHLSYRPLIQHVSTEPHDQHIGQQSLQPFPSRQPTGSAVVLPTSTVKPLEDTSVYYELNEDFQQTTVLGGEMPESSVMGSFWGKSPLYQSTPAFEIGKTAATSLMTSKFDEQDLTAGATNMVTPRVHRPLVDVQRTVIFRDFCCLGVSEKTWFPITNKSAYGLVCRLQVLQVVHNNRPSKLDIYSPFELKSKISIAPEASEDIPVLFVPKCPGEHVAHVEVLAQSLNPAFAPTCTIIQLQATAEAPSIQISPPLEVLDFGEVMWGTCQTRSIKLRNLKRASLPVRLSIWSSNSVWHCFTFDNSANSSDISIISLSSRPETFGRNIFTVQVPGCENEGVGQVMEIRLYCKPPTKEKNRALAERPAEKIEAKVLVEVDTPVQYLPALGTLMLQAVIGMPHLLIPPTHMSLKFKTEPERTIQETICLNNAGNISMELAIGVTVFPDCFQVKPRHVAIKPRSKAEVTVTFSPLEKDVSKYQSLLLLDIEPEGPSYELPMEARVVQPVRIQRTSPSILSSSSFLSFNGVALNQTKSLTLRLLNNDSQRTEHVLLEIRGATDCFKLVLPTGEWQQRSELVICPKQKQVVTVMFCPSAVRGYSSKLLIRIRDSGSSKYSIPLAGYGGRSVLTLSGACLTNYNQRWLELGPLSVGHNIMQDIVLTNSGVRAAFVKASSFYDMACREPVMPGRVALEPNNIVLAPGSSVKVMVAISPSKRERDLVKERKEMIAVVRFQHGDEVMRQKYQKVLAHDGRNDMNAWQASFAQQFANESQESIIKEGCTIPESPDDGPAFLHHLSTQIVALLAEPHPERDVLMEPVHIPHSQRLPKPSSGSAGGTESVVSRDTLKQYDPSGQFLVPNKPSDVDTEWIVKPDFLTLTVGESNQKMLQLLNFSRSNLRFELSWPSNSVVPEPQKGEIKPRSSVSIEVWLHMAWQKRITELPWHGDLTVTCNGKQKLVKVHIKNATLKPPLAVVSPTSLESMSMVSKLLPADAHLSASSQCLQLTSTNINFPCARVNESLESVIELTNVSSDPVHWKIQAFAPAYVKGADENNTVQRVGYSVFQIIPISGDLLPHESSKVPIKFCPKTRGTYNQHWEIEYQPLVGGKSVPVVTTTKIFITAEASSTENPMTAKQILGKGSLEKDKSQQRAPLQEKQHNTMRSGGEHHHTTVQDLLLLNPEVKFCDTVVGKVTQVKVEFKNSYDTNIQLETQAPKSPFFVKHLNFGITRRRFLKYPIEFHPSAPGDFEDTVVFRAPQLNKTFAVYLMGRGIEEKNSP